MRSLVAFVAAAALAAGAVACGDDPGEATRPSGPAAAAAIAAGESYAAERGADVRAGTRFLRSTRDPGWALVSGSRGTRGLWAVWVHAEGGRWRPRHLMLDGKGETRPAAVPCDIKPPFSEPDCPPRQQGRG